jgi:hypothetical protein
MGLKIGFKEWLLLNPKILPSQLKFNHDWFAGDIPIK